MDFTDDSTRWQIGTICGIGQIRESVVQARCLCFGTSVPKPLPARYSHFGISGADDKCAVEPKGQSPLLKSRNNGRRSSH